MTIKRMLAWGAGALLFVGVGVVSANDMYYHVEPWRMLRDINVRCLAAHLLRQTSPDSHEAVGSYRRRSAEAQIELQSVMLIDYHNALTPSICEAVMEVESLPYDAAVGDRHMLLSTRGVWMLRKARKILRRE